ncbi:MAG: hypothetical protein QOI78_8209 [Actinomycetota bacterium]|nr:hypothetical protein [Actinomycetota bacterium]
MRFGAESFGVFETFEQGKAHPISVKASLRDSESIKEAFTDLRASYSRSPMASIGRARSATRVDRPIDNTPSNTAPAMIPQ